jgi:hypothetical protein
MHIDPLLPTPAAIIPVIFLISLTLAAIAMAIIVNGLKLMFSVLACQSCTPEMYSTESSDSNV